MGTNSDVRKDEPHRRTRGSQEPELTVSPSPRYPGLRGHEKGHSALWIDGCYKVAPGTSLGSYSKELETSITRVPIARKNGEEGTFGDWGAQIIKEFLHSEIILNR